ARVTHGDVTYFAAVIERVQQYEVAVTTAELLGVQFSVEQAHVELRGGLHVRHDHVEVIQARRAQGQDSLLCLCEAWHRSCRGRGHAPQQTATIDLHVCSPVRVMGCAGYRLDTVEALFCCASNDSISATVSGRSTGGWGARNTPCAQSTAVRPTASAMSRRAPLAASQRMMSSRPRFAAPCTAAKPSSFCAFTSLPSEWAYFTASSRASGPSSKVCATVQLTPAAAISAVLPLKVEMLGSAPCSTSSFMVVMSPESAARMKGVCPVKFTQDRLPRRVIRRRAASTSGIWMFGSPPRASNSRTRSRAASRSMPLSVTGPATSTLRRSIAA